MNFNIVTIVFTVIFVYTFAKRQFAGTYEAKFRSLYVCKDFENKELFSTKVRKINRTHSGYTSNVTLPYGFSDRRKVEVDISIWGNGGWRENFMNFRSDHACTLGRQIFPNIGESFYAAAGYNFTKCPVPPGVYEVKNWTVQMRFGARILPYGRYRMKVVTYENKTKITCTMGEADLVPKEH